MSQLNVAVFSDIHLGGKRNTAEEIIKNLRIAFPNDASTAKLDIIFLAGDVFDGLLSLPDTAVTEISSWIAYLLYICAKHDILLRILEGTPSHDWKQSERFITISKIIKEPIDIKYVKELSIEYIEKFDINVLYVPDEWESSTEKTLSQVHELLRAKGLDKVDYAIMHGAFTHQLPEVVKCQKHDANSYLKIVRELIFIGHIHTHTTYDRIIAQGSFDRLSFGEEEPKGHVRAVVTDTGRNVTFVENKGAKIFKSIDCSFMSLEDTLSKIDSTVVGIIDGSYIRIIGNGDNPIFTNMNVLICKYPLLVWSKLIRDNEEEEEVFIEDDEVLFIPITITNANIRGLLMDRLNNSHINPEVLLIANELLSEVI